MINFEKAIEIVRKAYPNNLIRSFFVYKKKYIFELSLGKEYHEQDVAVFHVSVDEKTGEYALYDYWRELTLNNDPEFDKAIANTKKIDN